MDDKSFEQIAAERAQNAVDREVAARTELASSIANRVQVRSEIADGAAKAVAFIDQYVDATQPHPEPVAPEVAAPAPNVEPPVFTTVDSSVLDPTSTSGGTSDVAPELTVPAVDDGTGNTGGDGSNNGDNSGQG